MKIRESDLRQLIREELEDSPTLAMTKLSAGHAPEQSGVRPVQHDVHGVLDLSPLVDEVMELGQEAADLLRRSSGFLAHSPAWNDLEVHNSISNAIMKAIRTEVSRITRELEMEDEV